MDEFHEVTLGSLFDGSGGFPLAGTLVGITPIWSSEIELFPLRVTAARFPDVKQLGDVTKINGAEIDPVDIITFGSPCQDLSVAGKQKGIHDGERSNLFFEAVRIIKEMRNADKANGRSGIDIRPRFAVWENVPGAFSSNGGDDFKAVLEALAGVMQDGLDIPRPKKWNHAGGVAGDGWSIAWRVYDAQYWGVPQRRKRIYLVADFGSERAGEILFERESVSGDSAQGGETGEGTAADAERSVGGNGGVRCLNPWDVQSYRQYSADGAFATLQARENSGLNHQGVCYALQGNGIDRADTAGCNGAGWRVNEMYTLNTVDRPAIAATVGSFMTANEVVSLTLMARDFKDPQIVCYDARGNGDGKTAPTMTGDHQNRVTDYTALCISNDHLNQISMARKYIVRRLTPLECCRLQGFPDWWTDGVEGSDSAKYKMWGNGIALPCAVDVLNRIIAQKEREQNG